MDGIHCQSTNYLQCIGSSFEFIVAQPIQRVAAKIYFAKCRKASKYRLGKLLDVVVGNNQHREVGIACQRCTGYRVQRISADIQDGHITGQRRGDLTELSVCTISYYRSWLRLAHTWWTFRILTWHPVSRCRKDQEPGGNPQILTSSETHDAIYVLALCCKKLESTKFRCDCY